MNVLCRAVALAFCLAIAACAPAVDPTDRAAVGAAIEEAIADDGTRTLRGPVVGVGPFNDTAASLLATRKGPLDPWGDVQLSINRCCNMSSVGWVRERDRSLDFEAERISQSISQVTMIGNVPVVQVIPMNRMQIMARIEPDHLAEGTGQGFDIEFWDAGNNLFYRVILPAAYITAFVERMVADN